MCLVQLCDKNYLFPYNLLKIIVFSLIYAVPIGLVYYFLEFFKYIMFIYQIIFKYLLHAICWKSL